MGVTYFGGEGEGRAFDCVRGIGRKEGGSTVDFMVVPICACMKFMLCEMWCFT